MKTSVIIPSYNPTLKLVETLGTLLPQRGFIDELIIIIDNIYYNDFAKWLNEKYSTKIKMKIYPQPNSGRAVSRNKGAELSSGDILIFLDDDMIAEQDLIERHIHYQYKSSGIIVSGNGYRNPENAKDDFGRFLISMENRWRGNTFNSGVISLKKFNFTACNMSLPKEIFEKLGGFDTRFSDGEDFDFAVRAINKGIPIIYDNSLLAWHNDWPEIDTYIKRQNEYSLAKMKILKIHPDYLEYFPDLQSRKENTLKKGAVAIFSAIIGKWVISKKWFIEILPLNIKFLFYRIIISSNSNTNR